MAFLKTEIAANINDCHAEFKRSASETLRVLKDFVDTAYQHGIKEILLVSGGQPRKTLDSIGALDAISRWKDHSAKTNVLFGVAFNPYFPSKKDQCAERDRLHRKIRASSGKVVSIWLQFGTDLGLLKHALEYLRQQFPAQRLIGSVFIPSRKFLAQFKYRPWKGVFIRDEYLGDLQYAQRFTKQLLDTYAAFSVEPLFESAVTTVSDMATLEDLLTPEPSHRSVATEDISTSSGKSHFHACGDLSVATGVSAFFSPQSKLELKGAVDECLKLSPTSDCSSGAPPCKRRLLQSKAVVGQQSSAAQQRNASNRVAMINFDGVNTSGAMPIDTAADASTATLRSIPTPHDTGTGNSKAANTTAASITSTPFKILPTIPFTTLSDMLITTSDNAWAISSNNVIPVYTSALTTTTAAAVTMTNSTDTVAVHAKEATTFTATACISQGVLNMAKSVSHFMLHSAHADPLAITLVCIVFLVLITLSVSGCFVFIRKQIDVGKRLFVLPPPQSDESKVRPSTLKKKLLNITN